MELIPAIDLLGGRVVRLQQGDYAASTAYSDDPVAQARAFASLGAERLHVVDLDGARSGSPRHLEIISAILAEVRIAVQVGGGVRDRASAERWLEAGADRVVLGTIAVRAPDVASALCAAHPGRVVIAIDARGDDVAIEGWREASGESVRALAERADAWGAAAILYTDIAKDGTGEGPAVERTAALQRGLAATVIASGGIGAIEHVRALRDAGVRAAVCGRALYSGALDLREALREAGVA
jgi:phosphoribosylformimino-5-aminoimidazole carboxamide ribotide isomerase